MSLAVYMLRQSEPDVLVEPPPVPPKVVPAVTPAEVVPAEVVSVQQPGWRESIPAWAYVGAALAVGCGVCYLAYRRPRFDPIRYLHGQAVTHDLEVDEGKYKYIYPMSYYDVNILNGLCTSRVAKGTKMRLLRPENQYEYLSHLFINSEAAIKEITISESEIAKFQLSEARLRVYGTAFYITDKLKSANPDTKKRIEMKYKNDAAMSHNIKELTSWTKDISLLQLQGGKNAKFISDLTDCDKMRKIEESLLKLRSEL